MGSAETFLTFPDALGYGFYRRRGLFNGGTLDGIDQLFIQEPLSLRKPFEQSGTKFRKAIFQY